MAKKKNIRHIGEFIATNKAASKYKSNAHYISALYKKNKKKISNAGVSYEQFKSRMESIIKFNKLNRSEAARQYSRTRTFLSREEIGLQNIRNNIKKDLSIQIRKSTGKYKEKIDWQKDFKWDSDNKMYIHSSGNFGLVFTYPDDSKSQSIVDIVYLGA